MVLRKRYMRALFALVLTVILAVSAPLSVCGLSALAGNWGKLHWELYDLKELYISGSGNIDGENAPWADFRDSITDIIIEDGVTAVAWSAFSGYEALERVSIGNSVKVIDEYAFAWCEKLISVNIPASVESIGYCAFSDCPSLQKILVDSGNSFYCSDASGALLSKDMTQLIKVPSTLQGHYTVPNGVTDIDFWAFQNCEELECINLPETLSNIEFCAFDGCTALSSVFFTGNAPKIEEAAFCDISATAYYPGNDSTWSAALRSRMGDGLTWVPVYASGNEAPKELPTPKINKLENTASGVRISWDSVPGAEKYRVYVRQNGMWKNIGVTEGCSLTYKGTRSGEKYTFTVRCVNSANNTFTSYCSTCGWSTTYLSNPVISQLENTSSGIKISWKPVSGAEKYRVFVMTDRGWVGLGNTAANSYLYTGAISGESYTFTVRCISANEKHFTSSFDPVGKTLRHIAQPRINSSDSDDSGITLSWDPVHGAEKYRVYVRTESGWKNIGVTDNNSFTYDEAEKGNRYCFTVRCVNNANNKFTSSHDPWGWNTEY